MSNVYYVISLRCEYSNDDGNPRKTIRCSSLEEAARVVTFIRKTMDVRTGAVCPSAEDERTFDRVLDVVGHYAWIREIVSVKHVVETDVAI